MAYETGTATDAADLYAKLIAFLTTDADLIADDEEWTAAWTASGGASEGLVLTGAVPAGDAPKVGMKLVVNPLTATNEIQFTGLVNVLSGATQITEHGNTSPIVRLFADSNPMTYWFAGSGRRFVVTVKISTVYATAYCGLFLPYALPTSYPYPMYVAACAGLGSNQIADWRSNDPAFASIALPHHRVGTTAFRPATAYVLAPQAQWEIVTVPTSDGSGGDVEFVMTHPYSAGGVAAGSQRRMYPDVALGMQVAGPNSVFATHAISLFRRTPASQVYGVLDGVVACQGRSNAAENEITIGADDYLVVQDAFRTTVGRYFAVIKG